MRRHRVFRSRSGGLSRNPPDLSSPLPAKTHDAAGSRRHPACFYRLHALRHATARHNTRVLCGFVVKAPHRSRSPSKVLRATQAWAAGWAGLCTGPDWSPLPFQLNDWATHILIGARGRLCVRITFFPVLSRKIWEIFTEEKLKSRVSQSFNWNGRGVSTHKFLWRT